MTSKSSKSLSKNSEENFVMPDDVKKVGYMKKLKTMKKKYFVLRDNCDANEASLAYYDNEKKFKNAILQPKRSIFLRDCFSINRKIDAKHKYAIALYTKDECFAVEVDNEIQMKEWLEAMIELQSQSNDSKQGHHSHYDHVWQVNINKNGLGQTRNMTGPHRLCLTANTLYIVKFDPQTDSPDVYEFPLISIRRCGHTSNTFFIELGRSSSIGPGELWIQADDSVMAQNMHEVILNAMKSSKNDGEFGPSQRPRSASTSDKPISSRRPLTSTNQNNPIFGTPVQTYSSSTSTSVPTQSTAIDSMRERCDSMPSRSRTNENESSHDSKMWTSVHYHTSDRMHSGHYNRTVSYSPPSNNPLSPSSGACSTDSVGSSLSNEDFESNHLSLAPMSEHHLSLHNSLIPSEPPISEEDVQVEDYLSMEPNSDSHHLRSQMNLSFRSTNTGNTSPLTSPTFSSSKSFTHSIKEEISPYMPMSPVGSIDTDSMSSSRRSSGLDRNLIIDMSSEYMPMISGQERESTKSEEYLNMAPLSESLPKTNNLSNQKSLIKEEYHLEKVKSYFSPAEENDSLDYIKPVRAYSIGSRPQIKTNVSISSKMNSKSRQLGTQTPEEIEETRIRAFSMGSHANAREARIAAKKKALIEGQIGGPNIPIEEVAKSSKKASSAPVLSPVAPRKRSATVGSRPIFNKLAVSDKSDTDLMEIDYSKSMQSKSFKEKFNEDRMKRSSAHRQRSNSRSSTSSSGIGSASTTSPSITSSLNELNDKRKDQMANSVISMVHKNADEMIQTTGNRVITKETPNEYLQIVITNSNQETKLPLRPITSQVSQLPTVPSVHSNDQQIQTKTLPTTISEKIAQKLDEKSKKTNISDDSGDYVCLDISSTNYVPQNSKSSVALTAAENVPKITTNSQLNHSINENKSVSVPQFQNNNINSNINNNVNNTGNNNDDIYKSRPISGLLPEVKKQRSVPNAETFAINFRQASCPSNLNQQISLSPSITSKVTNNQQICQTLSKSSPDRNSISGELAAIESKSFQTIGSQIESSYENVSLGSGSSSRPSSVSSERELNYASLDLAPSSSTSSGANYSEINEELKTMSPRSLKSPNQLSLCANVVSSPSSSCATPIASLIPYCGSQELLQSSADSSSLSYAEIDFKKSEGLRNTASNGRN